MAPVNDLLDQVMTSLGRSGHPLDSAAIDRLIDSGTGSLRGVRLSGVPGQRNAANTSAGSIPRARASVSAIRAVRGSRHPAGINPRPSRSISAPG